MRKLLVLPLTAAAWWLAAACTAPAEKNTTPVNTETEMPAAKSLYDLSYTDIDGKPVKLSQYKGKKILFVNVASECGNTPQYEGLQKLYSANKDKMVILGFPCNQFGGQEPGGSAEVKSFCTKNYGVEFPLSEKIEVKGDKKHPVYQWLTQKDQNGKEDSEVTWNFQKYVVDEKGNYVAMFAPRTQPDDPALLKALGIK